MGSVARNRSLRFWFRARPVRVLQGFDPVGLNSLFNRRARYVYHGIDQERKSGEFRPCGWRFQRIILTQHINGVTIGCSPEARDANIWCPGWNERLMSSS